MSSKQKFIDYYKQFGKYCYTTKCPGGSVTLSTFYRIGFDAIREAENKNNNYYCNRILNDEEIEIINGIAKCSIFDFQDIKEIYLKTRSYDETSYIIKKAVKENRNIHEVATEEICK